jgi:hypothetical protein
VLPQPQFIREGDWIAMPGVPLISAGNVEVARGAAADVEGDVAVAQCDDARITEEATRPGAENVRDDGAKGPSDETERAEATVNTIVPTLTSVETAAAPEGDAVPAPDENIPTAASTEETPVGDTSEMAHATELEATLLCRQLTWARGPPEPAAAELTEPPVLTTEAEV